MVREIMKLAFLMERHYAPYSKWFGSAFTKLRIGAKPTPTLQQLSASLFSLAFHVFAYSLVAKQHNALKITKHLPTKVTKYYDRPYLVFFFFNFTATTEIYTLSLHDALPISAVDAALWDLMARQLGLPLAVALGARSEEHTSELQSRRDLVCRLLLEKKN